MILFETLDSHGYAGGDEIFVETRKYKRLQYWLLRRAPPKMEGCWGAFALLYEMAFSALAYTILPSMVLLLQHIYPVASYCPPRRVLRTTSVFKVLAFTVAACHFYTSYFHSHSANLSVLSFWLSLSIR